MMANMRLPPPTLNTCVSGPNGWSSRASGNDSASARRRSGQPVALVMLGDVQPLVDDAHDRAGVLDAAEAELGAGLLGAGRVPVDVADAEQPLEQGLGH